MSSVPSSYLAEKRDRYGITAIFKSDHGAAMFLREGAALLKHARVEVPPGQAGERVVVLVRDTWSNLPKAEQAGEVDKASRVLQDLMNAVEIYGGTHAVLT
jgi:hypothetical protein